MTTREKTRREDVDLRTDSVVCVANRATARHSDGDDPEARAWTKARWTP